MKRRKRSLASKLLDCVFPPKCPICGELLKKDEYVFCASCGSQWEAAKRRRCPICGSPAMKCLCGESLLYDSGVRDHIKLACYESGGGGAVNRIIYSLKRDNYRLLFDRIADECAAVLEKYLSNMGIEQRDTVITYPGRTKASERAAGYDHAELLSRKIADRLGIVHMKTVVRHGGKPQKSLSGAERVENARKSVIPMRGIDLTGKYVIVFDDVVTTGATVARTAQIIFSYGAVGVSVLSVTKAV